MLKHIKSLTQDLHRNFIFSWKKNSSPEYYFDGHEEDAYENDHEEETQVPTLQEEKFEDKSEVELGHTPLMVDLFEVPHAFVIQAILSGAKPSQIDISITRNEVTITGHRHPPHRHNDTQYVITELQWGPFHRSIRLPDEIDVNAVEANEDLGILTINLPKFNKHQKAKVKIRSIGGL